MFGGLSSMNWQEVCEHPSLQDLPFKIELNAYGQLVMTPRTLFHSACQGEMAGLLSSFLPAGHALVGCPIQTTKGTKVADVAWVSQQRLEQIQHEVECSIAPEICVEVVYSYLKQIRQKRKLYFEKGAEEVWICAENGKMTFYDAHGLLEHSHLVAEFPAHIEI